MSAVINGTDGITFPTWTTATRPASPLAGQTGYNTTTGSMEVYNGSAWTSTNGVWTTATRPASPPTGTIGFNTTTSVTEVYNGSAWTTLFASISTGWSVTPSGTTLYFNYNGTNVAKLDSSGNLTTLANITAYGTV